MPQTIESILQLFDRGALYTTASNHPMTDKMVGNIAAWASVPEGETVIAVTPLDIGLKGKKGMAICATGIYWKNGALHEAIKMTWEQLAQTSDSLIAHPKNKHLEFVGGKYYETPHAAVMSNTVLRDVLTRLAQHWSQSPDTFQQEATEFGLPVTSPVNVVEVDQADAKGVEQTGSNESQPSVAAKEVTPQMLAHIALFLLAMIWSPVGDSFILSLLTGYALWSALALVRPDYGFSSNPTTHRNTLIGCCFAMAIFFPTIHQYDAYVESHQQANKATPKPASTPEPAKTIRPATPTTFATVGDLYDNINYNYSLEDGSLVIHQNSGSLLSVTVKGINSRNQLDEYLMEDIQHNTIKGIYTLFIHSDAQMVSVTSSLLDLEGNDMRPDLTQTVTVTRDTALKAIWELGVATSFDQLLEQHCYGDVCDTQTSDRWDRIMYNDDQPGRTKVYNYLKARSRNQRGV